MFNFKKKPKHIHLRKCVRTGATEDIVEYTSQEDADGNIRHYYMSREIYNAAHREYYKGNGGEKVRAAARRYNAKNRDEINRKQRERYAAKKRLTQS